MKESIMDVYRRCRTILYYLKSQSQGEKSNALFVDFEQVLETTFKSNNVKGMMILKRDLEAWSKALSEEKQKELNTLLKGNKIYQEQEQLLSKTLQLGHIDLQEDYFLLIEILKDITEQDEHYVHLATLERMVANYNGSKSE